MHIQAFLRGKKDFYKGNLDNPYKDFTKSREWERGFNTSYFTNLKKVKNEERKSGTRG